MTTHTPDPIPPASGDLEAVARIRDAIWSDICDRSGFDLSGLDDEVQHDIRTAWDAAILAALRPAVVGEAVACLPCGGTGTVRLKTQIGVLTVDCNACGGIERTTPASHDALIARVREKIDEAFTAGAMSVHEYWTENPGEAPAGDPEFGEAAGDHAYAAVQALLADLDAEAGR